MSELVSNPLFIPLVVLAVVALTGWLGLLGVVLGQRELIRLAFDSFPKEQAIEMTDRFYEFAKQSESRWDDFPAQIGKALAGRYDAIRDAAVGGHTETPPLEAQARRGVGVNPERVFDPTDIQRQMQYSGGGVPLTGVESPDSD